MFAVPSVRAAMGALLVSLLPTPRAEVDGLREKAPPVHTLAVAMKATSGAESSAWATRLGAVEVECGNTGAKARIRLYDERGTIDEDALWTFMETVAEDDRVRRIDARTVQLAFKAAYHFDAPKMHVVSSYRRGHGPHAAAEALDFRLPGVSAARLAAYLRTLPRVGVGVYTHPRTQFVHLDSRDQSFHWLDGSPPGKTWRERALPDKSREERDRHYLPDGDLPLDAKL